MYTTISESLGKEKLILKASAATVGRPTGVDGKKRVPRRARVTGKELEKLTTKGLKAGGPGSGRKPEVDHSQYQSSTGKTPSGYGRWGFGPERNTASDKVFFHTGKYSEAKKAAQDWGQKQGHTKLHVQS